MMHIFFGYIGADKKSIENNWLRNAILWLDYNVEDISFLKSNENTFFHLQIDIKEKSAKISCVNKYIDGCVFYNSNIYRDSDFEQRKKEIKDVLETGACGGRYTAVSVDGNSEISIFNDYYGFKPFFYYVGGKGIYFSNDIRFLLLCDEIPFEIDFKKCKITNTEDYVNNENFDVQTYFKGIKKLPSGVKCVIKNNNVEIFLIYKKSIFYNDKFLDFKNKEKYYSLFRSTLNKIVEKYVSFYGNGNIGVSLSGGIDSAVILASLIDMGYKDRIICYHATSKNPQYFSCDDSDIVRQLVKALGVKCKILYQNEGNSICNAVLGRDFIKNINGPCCIGNDSFSYHLSAELEKDKVSLIFGGDGGDYLFMGTRYCADVFANMKLKNDFLQHKLSLKKQGKINFLYKYAQFIPFVNNHFYVKNFWSKEREVEYPKYFTKQMCEINKKQTKNHYKESKKLKFWSRRFVYDYMFPKNIGDDEQNDGFEFVHPLLDISIYLLAQKIPPFIHYDVSKGEVGSYYVQKRVLREAYKDILPKIITEQKFKTNYAPSIVIKFKKESKNIVKLLLEDEKLYLSEYGIVNKDKFLKDLESFLFNIDDPHFMPNISMKYMCNLIYLEIWFKEINKGRKWLLQQCKIFSKENDISEVEIING